MAKRIAIVGAGISGLALAWQLRKRMPRAQLTIFEKAERPGGSIWSERSEGFLVEHGPNGFLDNKTATIELCRELGLGDLLICASEGARKNRYVFWNGRLQALPNSLGSFVTSRLLSWRSKWNLMTEQYRRERNIPADESIDAFARRRAGAHIADVVAGAMVTGIHGGDAKLLSLPAAFPRLAQLEREFGSVFGGMKISRKRRKAELAAVGKEPPPPGGMWTFREGLRVLIEKLCEVFRPELRLGLGIDRIERIAAESPWRLFEDRDAVGDFDAVILTAPAYAQARLLAPLDAELGGELAGIAYNRIAVVALGYSGNPAKVPTDGFGYIAPGSLRRDVLGVQWCSSIYAGRAGQGMTLWRALCGGWFRPEMVDWPDADLVAAVRGELKAAMGVSEAPVFHRVIRWDRAIPQYFLGHGARVARVEAILQRYPGLLIGGNAIGGVGLNDCAEGAIRLAERTAAALAPDSQGEFAR